MTAGGGDEARAFRLFEFAGRVCTHSLVRPSLFPPSPCFIAIPSLFISCFRCCLTFVARRRRRESKTNVADDASYDHDQVLGKAFYEGILIQPLFSFHVLAKMLGKFVTISDLET